MMPTRQDFKAYHKSVAGELRMVKDRVRQLIGDAHWQTEGEHKEAVLRKILRSHAAGSLQFGRGFVCGNGHTSSQIDILVTQRDRPTLFREGETLLVTPEAVSAVIEVKTSIDAGVRDELNKLADNVEMVRSIGNPQCVAGLFVYDADQRRHAADLILRAVQEASRGTTTRVINWIAVGPDLFIRYWPEGRAVNSAVADGVWHGYTLQHLAHAYFVSNVVWDTCARVDPAMQYAWFPVEGTKERYRERYIALDGAESRAFEGR